ncbi:hypothetical protein AGABI1DRAFT_107237 [Agaricus bisporus var. burnettii JB137-S8]|uniref:NAD-dependent epimerase/dehydratase domain-containing protein n=1 Tax=Agaricus bisporus var. burnettii (strain JB137-S8 / ATCC MYA-4627 / FGSC 10392) TaxID=597362 RepID=K5X6D4_AGABU|nr:uncharacterized protein AGABI1DRAFT_107237 [Agaricus bisporus var. burnettii JB137-S8]EKM78748.1 hypothetical protein AGABI1DRAFT_107237 [Agaricus bisporus var. burnettii JB137-S8]
MGVTAAPSKVLITGANGYIAMWVIDFLLKAGYSVRGAIRGLDKTKDLNDKFSSWVASGTLEFIVVKDVTIEGAFDDAVKDVDGVLHMASPVVVDADDPQDVINPAVSGALGLLKSALKHGNRVDRVVFTSSTATIFAPVTKPTVLNESNWNTVTLEEVERLGRAATSHQKYRASKILAEKGQSNSFSLAVWEFYEANKERSRWDITVINPPFVFGPALNNFENPAHQNASTRVFWDNVIANPGTPQSVNYPNCWVDVREVALAHVLALQKPEAGGERLIVSVGPFVWQDFIDIASTHLSPLKTHQFPHHEEFNGYLPKGYPDIEKNHLLNYDNSKALRIFGPELTYRTMEETTKDILDDYAVKGW